MAVNENVARAAAGLRTEPVDHWVDLSESIMRRVRATALPGETLVTFDPEGRRQRDDAGSEVYVAERVVVAALREALSEHEDYRPHAIDLVMDRDRCSQVYVEIAGRYRAVLPEAAEDAHARAAHAWTALIGPDPAFDTDRDLHVEVVDLLVD